MNWKRISLVSLLLLSLSNCTNWQPYWTLTGPVADDDKIHINYVDYDDLDKYCHGISKRGCTVRSPEYRAAEIYVVKTDPSLACLIRHEWKHAKGWNHGPLGTDC